jgi:sugar phosphate isomerase/epimerase
MEKFPDLKICLDTTHTQKYNRFPIKEYIDVLKDRLCHLHISDAFAPDEAFARMHTTPGKGIILQEDWLYLLKALEEIDFQGEAVLEIIPPSPVRIARETGRFFNNLSCR